MAATSLLLGYARSRIIFSTPLERATANLLLSALGGLVVLLVVTLLAALSPAAEPAPREAARSIARTAAPKPTEKRLPSSMLRPSGYAVTKDKLD